MIEEIESKNRSERIRDCVMRNNKGVTVSKNGKKWGRPKKPSIRYIPGRDCTDRKNIEDAEEEENKMLLGIATQSELDWFKQKVYEMRRDRAIKRRLTKESHISAREKAFWEAHKNEIGK